MNKMTLYHFGDCGPMDQDNPFQLLSRSMVPELLQMIAKQRNGATSALIEDWFEQKAKHGDTGGYLSHILSELLRLKMITENTGLYRLAFPFFIEEDLSQLRKVTEHAADQISNRIADAMDQLIEKLGRLELSKRFGPERLLYHIIADQVLDGVALDYFGDKGAFCMTKSQTGNRAYLLVGYEDADELHDFSAHLLCSSNNYRAGRFTFNSFGDAAGDRCDLFRLFRKKEAASRLESVGGEADRVYMTNLRKCHQGLALEAGERIERILSGGKSPVDEVYALLSAIGYVTDVANEQSVEVPVFRGMDYMRVEQIKDDVLRIIEEPVLAFFRSDAVQNAGFHALTHMIGADELGNEIWHVLFGQINERLIERGLIANPLEKQGEGRYFRALYIEPKEVPFRLA